MSLGSSMWMSREVTTTDVLRCTPRLTKHTKLHHCQGCVILHTSLHTIGKTFDISFTACAVTLFSGKYKYKACSMHIMLDNKIKCFSIGPTPNYPLTIPGARTKSGNSEQRLKTPSFMCVHAHAIIHVHTQPVTQY